MIENKPSYYAILTAEVRYDNRLNANQKLLYAELTALANTHGYAWPSNEYLANLYGVSDKTISRNIQRLKELKYIKVIEQKSGTGTVRKIYINSENNPLDKNVPSEHNPLDKNVQDPLDKNVHPPLDKNVQCNSINNTSSLIIQGYNNRELDISNKLDIKSKKNIELPTLSLIENLGNKLKIKEHVYRKFYNYYKVRDFITQDNIQIDTGNLENFLILWNDREINYNLKDNSKKEVYKPDWVEEYTNELKEMELMHSD